MNAHWHILGAGAIGGLFAQRLSQGGARVTLLDHHADPASSDTITERKLRFEQTDTVTEATFPVSSTAENAPIKRLLVTTKSYDVVAAIAALANRLTADCCVVIMVNGLGWEQPLRRQYPNLALFAGSTTAGSFRPSKDILRLSGVGMTQLGPLLSPAQRADDTDDAHSRSAPPQWFSQWKAGSPNTEWQADMHPILLRKLAINCAINPLTAAHNVANGALLSAQYLPDFERGITEISAVLSAMGERQLAETLGRDARAVAQATAGNISSMCADIRAGRRSEIDNILGYLLTTLKPQPGQEIATPLLDALFTQLRRY